MLSRSSWQCGPISTGGVAVGFTNIVAIVLGVLLYYNHLEKFSITIIVVTFACVVLLLTNAFLVYGSVHTKPGFVLPWLALYVLATGAAVVFLGIKWSTFGGYKGASIGAVVFSLYFIVVVTELYHHLRQETVAKEVPEDAEEGEVGTVRPDGTLHEDGTLLLDIDQTDLVQLGASPAATENGLPKPDEIINVQAVAFNSKNPFLTDIFKTDSVAEAGDDSTKVKERNSAKVSLLTDINADFSPFRNPAPPGGGDAPKMKVFLPKPIDYDSDADFSFDTSRAEFSFNEGNNMCKIEEEQA